VTTRGDRLVERGADKLEDLAKKLSAHGEWGTMIAEDLTIDADFLRKLKPSLIVARARGQAPTNGGPPAERATVATPPAAPTAKKPGRGGPNPLLIVGGALVAGIVLAKVIDWRGHAHPRD
jgi:hypothetical protein